MQYIMAAGILLHLTCRSAGMSRELWGRRQSPSLVSSEVLVGELRGGADVRALMQLLRHGHPDEVTAGGSNRFPPRREPITVRPCSRRKPLLDVSLRSRYHDGSKPRAMPTTC